jgi:hypothetical protein
MSCSCNLVPIPSLAILSLLVRLVRLGLLIAPTPSRPPFPIVGYQSDSVTGAPLMTVVMPRT